MKICFVTTNFPRHLEDSEGTFVWEAARAVARRGHQVRVIAQHWPGLPTYEKMAELEVFRPRYWWPESAELLRKGGGGLPIIWRQSWLARLQILPFILIHTLAIARYASKCDVIHAYWTLSAGAAWLSQVIHHRPILVTLQGSDIFQVTRSQWGAWLTRFVLQRCQRISAISQALAASAAGIGISPSTINIIPNGVNLAQFVPLPSSSRQPIILYVGTLIKRKGVVHLIEAMAEVTRRHPLYRLVIIGEGPEQPFLENVTARLGLIQCVSFVGLQTRAQVCQWMQQAKLFVLPSLEEGLGVVLVEALACGAPIIATQVGGIPDVVTPDVGRLTPPANSTSLAEAIIQVLNDEQQWAGMSKNARMRAEQRYDWNQIAAQYITIYEEMLTEQE